MVHTLTCNAFGEQTYVVEHGDGGLTVVDPGMASGEERKAFQDLCDRLDAKPVQVVLTHAHLDHVMGCAWMKDTYGLVPRLHPADRETYEQAPRVAEVYGVRMDPVPEATFDLAHGDTVACGKWSWRCVLCRATPLATWRSCATAEGGPWAGTCCSGAAWGGRLAGLRRRGPAQSIEAQIFTLPNPWWCGQVTAGPRRWGTKSREPVCEWGRVRPSPA